MNVSDRLGHACVHHVRNRVDLQPTTDMLSARGQTLPFCLITVQHCQRKPRQARIHQNTLTLWRHAVDLTHPRTGPFASAQRLSFGFFLSFHSALHQLCPVLVWLSVFEAILRGFLRHLYLKVTPRLLKIQNYKYTIERTGGWKGHMWNRN